MKALAGKDGPEPGGIVDDGLGAVLDALPHPVLTVNASNVIGFVNSAAEVFLGGSASVLTGRDLRDLLPADSPLLRLTEQARAAGSSISDYDLLLEIPGLGARMVNIEVSPVAERDGELAVLMSERSVVHRLRSQLRARGAARSISAMAAMLAHEVKNPLSGIRGAAQLLEQTIGDSDTGLTRLICNETDRICALVDRIEVFADDRPIEKCPINIHEVLDHCRNVAANGFGRHVSFAMAYDPSLPGVLGNRDILIQLFINLLKNACEAVPETGGTVVLATAYRHSITVVVDEMQGPVALRLMVSVKDNGPGISKHLRANLFEPFVTSKRSGSGLGLAFVAKAVADHGGIVEIVSGGPGTDIRVTLPHATTRKPGANGDRQ